MLRLAALLLLSVFALSAQDRVSPEFMYHRVWAVVPIIGSGTNEDPRRPMFVPSPVERRADAANRAKQGKGAEKRPAILGYSMQLSDDGQTALVEFVGADPESLRFITESTAPGVKAFERGKAKKEDIEAEFKKHKKAFKLDSFGGRAQ
jgi:hypothetical protein